jgi:type IV secretion system protein VirB4
MMYLFKRIEASLDGRLTGVYLDEGWQFLNHPYWIQKLKSYFFTWRKLNAFIVFATQLPDLVAESPLASTLIQGAATMIFLPNPKAEPKAYCGAFQLNAKELAFIQESPVDDRYFLFKQGHLSSVLRVDLREMKDYLAVFSANQHSLAIFDAVKEMHGTHWLPAFYQKVRVL